MLDAIGTFLLPAALVLGAPVSPGTHEHGLFCETVALVERVAEFADRGANPLRVVADINQRLALLGQLDPQHAKAGLAIVERHALDQAGQGLRLGLGRGEREIDGGGRSVLSAGSHGART